MIVLANNEIKLREFTLEDKTQLAVLCNNKKIWDNVRDIIPFPYSEKDASFFIEGCIKEKTKTTFAIEKNRILVGVIGLVLQSDIYRLSAEIGYWIGEPYWGQGIATEAVKLLTEYGFTKLNLIRIFSGVFDYNKPSQKVLEKSGYTLDGIFKKAVIKNNNIHDEYRYSILKKENG